jgi:mitochondrial chaperone BCS1
MITNKLEKLGEAFVRSGIISVRVGFEKATSEQARDIFMRMYWDEDGSEKSGLQAKAAGYTYLEELARKFGGLVLDYFFSPADLQNFLLTRRKSSQCAIGTFEEWKVKTMEERAKKADNDANWRKGKT